MQSTRARFIASGAGFAIPAVIRYPAGAAEFNYKLAFTLPISGFPPTVRAVEAAEKITQASGGRLEIKVFPNSQLGGATEILGQLRLGSVEMTLTSDSDSTTIVPVLGMTALPFVASTHKQGVALLSGAFGGYVHNAFAKVGVYQLRGSWSLGFHQVETYLRPVLVPTDLKGMKLRSTDAAPEIALLRALGATAVSITAAQQYSSLQTHLVDGATSPVLNAVQFKFYEVTKFLSLTNHNWGGMSTLVNAAAWERLPKNLQDIVAQNFDASRNLSNGDMESADAGAIEVCKTHGMSVNSVDALTFRKAINEANLYAQFKTQYPNDAWTLFEKAAGRTL